MTTVHQDRIVDRIREHSVTAGVVSVPLRHRGGAIVVTTYNTDSTDCRYGELTSRMPMFVPRDGNGARVATSHEIKDAGLDKGRIWLGLEEE